MKQTLLLSLLVLMVGSAVAASKNNIRLIAESPKSEILAYRGSAIAIDDNNISVVPRTGSKDSGFEIVGKYDFSDYRYLRFTFENRDSKPLALYLTVAHAPISYYRARAALRMAVGDVIYIGAHEKREIELPFPAELEYKDVEEALNVYDNTRNMLYTPYSHAMAISSYAGDMSRVCQILFKVKGLSISENAVNGWRVTDLEVVAGKRAKNPKVMRMPYDKFFPFIDRYGQYRHAEWPGKIHSDKDLQKARKVEEVDLAKHAGPADRNKYGGWANGPRQEATGRFYFKKVDGKWWFVDPEGCLWWSHGVVRVTPSSAVTPLDKRHFYFEGLPAEGGELAQFYHTNDALLKPYYIARNIKETYDFSSSNIYRKYGKDYKQIYGEMAHRRLRSWGLNTIANSSDKDICLMSKTPYIERLEMLSKPIEGTGGLWWTFSDPFDVSFKQVLIAQLKERAKELSDPYLVGFFVDNELKWGDESFLATMAAKNPASAAVKQELVKHYKAKYGDIAALNKVWGTSFTSWEALLANTQELPEQSHADLVEFNDCIIHKYFRNIREVFDEYAPGVLYLGCRFAGSTTKALVIGAQYCDAISHNYYRYTVEDYVQPKGIDKPMIIGEFHFGTIDRGLFHHSLIEVADQKARGRAYADYVRSALEHPNIVGTHWHQFSDQATTGRFDGENFNVGFTDVCDTPYYETVDGIREVGYDMYNIRARAK